MLMCYKMFKVRPNDISFVMKTYNGIPFAQVVFRLRSVIEYAVLSPLSYESGKADRNTAG